MHLRGRDVTRHVRERGRGVHATLFREAELFPANPEHVRQAAIALGRAPGKVLVMGSPIDTGHFAPPARREPFEARALRLLAVGRLVEKEGFADAVDAVDAVARLAAQGREVTLDVLGDGPLGAALRRRAGAGVPFHGAADARAVRAALHRADVALAPSVTAADGDQDGPVNMLEEAMGTGLPVIGTRHGVIPELIDENNGLLVPERDSKALAGAIARLVGAPRRLGAAKGRGAP